MVGAHLGFIKEMLQDLDIPACQFAASGSTAVAENKTDVNHCQKGEATVLSENIPPTPPVQRPPPPRIGLHPLLVPMGQWEKISSGDQYCNINLI